MGSTWPHFFKLCHLLWHDKCTNLLTGVSGGLRFGWQIPAKAVAVVFSIVSRVLPGVKNSSFTTAVRQKGLMRIRWRRPYLEIRGTHELRARSRLSNAVRQPGEVICKLPTPASEVDHPRSSRLRHSLQDLSDHGRIRRSLVCRSQ